MPESSEQNTLAYVDTVIVPVANPATAHHLIRLALALVHPEKGKVIALTVTLGDTEKEAETLDEITPICDSFAEDGHPVELVTRTAPNIARGILDAVREEDADLIVLGLNKPEHGQVMIGSIAESVVSTAPCDVLIYRAGLHKGAFERIVVPANGSTHSRVALRVGVLFGQYYDKPVEAMYVQGSENAYWQGRGRLEEALHSVPGTEAVKRTLVTARDPASGILSRLTEEDLLVVGYVRQSQMQRWMYGDFSRELLNHTPGPVVLTAQLAEPESDDGVVQRLTRWLRPTLTRVEQDELVRQAQGMAEASLDFTVLIVVAALLASFGLLTSSAAVIIGAMLVAPLMSPLIGFSVGMTTGRIPLVRRSAITVIQGFLLAVGIALLVGLISPTQIVTPEMAARGNPTVLDMGIALASGIIGAYATARKEIPAALAGVAIAAALVPPVCTIGLGIAYGNAALSRGAALLFTTNIISIILAAWLVFFWLGMRPQLVEESRVRQYVSGAMVLLFVGILGIFLLSDVNPSTFESGIEEHLRGAFQQDELVDFEVRRSDPIQIIATLRRAANRLDDNSEVIAAQQALQETLSQPVNLDVIIEPFYNAETLVAQETLNAALRSVPLVDTQVSRDDSGGLIITAIVSPDDLTRAQNQLAAVQAALNRAFNSAVTLQFQSEVQDEATPAATAVPPEATVEAP
ncbi:MAG: TIGR00341 family protein [Anaerolineae bacterium]|nr:TIGR00341 family protein [Anaerolineae bacterium]